MQTETTLDKPVLNTKRLSLFIPNENDAPRMLAYIIRNKEHFRNSSPACDDFYILSYWQDKLKNTRQNFKDRTALSLVLIRKEDPERQIIGNLTFDGIIRGYFQACYLGYRLDYDFTNCGFMTEALNAAIAFIFNDWKIHRIMANCRPDNEKSYRILRNLGFITEGYARDYLFLDGQWRDHILNSLTNPNFVF